MQRHHAPGEITPTLAIDPEVGTFGSGSKATEANSRAGVEHASKGPEHKRQYGPRRLKVQQPVEAANVPAALLTFETVGALCGVCIRTVERRQAAGELGELVRLGPKVVRLRARNVTAWLDAQLPASQSPLAMPRRHASSNTPSTTPLPADRK